MQAKEGVVDRLNAALTNELTAVNQYFLQAEMCKNWGFERLYEHFRAFSLDEMRDSQELVRHVLYLDGLPNMQRLGPIRVGETAIEHLQLDLDFERSVVESLREAIAHCASVGDFNTRAMFERMIHGEEEQVDWLETQLAAVERVGVQGYLTEQLH